MPVTVYSLNWYTGLINRVEDWADSPIYGIMAGDDGKLWVNRRALRAMGLNPKEHREAFRRMGDPYYPFGVTLLQEARYNRARKSPALARDRLLSWIGAWLDKASQ